VLKKSRADPNNPDYDQSLNYPTTQAPANEKLLADHPSYCAANKFIHTGPRLHQADLF